MGKSISYHIVALVLKLKGVKKVFSTSPINYKKLRKEDVKEPKGGFFKKNATSFKVLETVITRVISRENKSKKLLLFFPGGAFVSGPARHHWDTIKKIHKNTDYTIWLCDYPKAPEHKIGQISVNVDAVYQEALMNYDHKDIVLMGDSVGGTLTMALVQRLIKREDKLPKKIFLISPVVDASMSNPILLGFEKDDIMLGVKGTLSAHTMCAEHGDLKASDISPMYGSLKGFPATIVYLATNDIMYYDALKMFEKREANSIIIGKGMPHIWPFLPFLKEGELALKEIIETLNC